MPVAIIYCHSVINKATGELQFQKLQEENPENVQASRGFEPVLSRCCTSNNLAKKTTRWM